mgnify:CR=1 FL=1
MNERTGDISPTTWRRMVTVELVCWVMLTVGFLSAVPAAYRAVAAGPVEESGPAVVQTFTPAG